MLVLTLFVVDYKSVVLVSVVMIVSDITGRRYKPTVVYFVNL